MRTFAFALAVTFASSTAQAVSAQAAAGYVEISQPAESLDQFALRIAPKAAKLTKATGMRQCGIFTAQPDSSYRIEIRPGTRYSCGLPAGLGPYFTTHPSGTIRGLSDSEFAAAGYLALSWTLLHQDGPGTTRTVGQFKNY